MKPGRVEGDFGEPYYDVMIARVASQPAQIVGRERWAPDAVAIRFEQYQQVNMSRLTHVSKPVGHDTPREHHVLRHRRQ